MAFPRITPALFLAILSTPCPMGGQLVFDWPIRAEPQPEAVLMGAVSLFWNPGGLVSGPGTLPELWIIHVDGPDATGVGGLAVSSAIELPWEANLGVGYSHLGVSDIPRTTTSPERLPGNIGVSEDVAILGLARDLDGRGGVGASFRIQRGEAAGNVHTSLRADLGVQVRSTLPLNPRFGLTVRDVSGKGSVLGGMELTLPPLASGRLPVRFGYGLGAGGERERAEHRLSLRGSWLGQIHAGLGTTRWSAEDGWTTLWMVGADIGRYSLSVLREELANGFGAVHFYRATIRLPNGSS